MKYKAVRGGFVLAAIALALAPDVTRAAGSGARGHAASTSAPKPIAVYVGSRLIASGQNLSGAIGKVRGQVPFTIGTPRYTPAGYVPVQLYVTPQQRDVSGGRTTLSYVLTSKGKVPSVMSTGFTIDQAARPLPFVRGTHTTTVTVGSGKATLNEFKAPGTDLLILSGVTSAGGGYDVVTDAAASHLTSSTLVRIAASLK